MARRTRTCSSGSAARRRWSATSTTGGIDSLGHRRWLLNPAATTFGSGSTGSTDALYVVDSGGFPSTPVSPTQVVAWPPAGWVPWAWVFEDWSVSVGGAGAALRASFTDPQVTVTVDGQPAATSDVTPVATGAGSGVAVRWHVDLPDALREGDHTIVVSVSGVSTADGQPLPLTWTIQAFNADPVPVRFSAAPAIRVAGRAASATRPGQALTVEAAVTHGHVASYQWRRNGVPIPAATAATYRVRRADRGRRIDVLVTAVADDAWAQPVRRSSRTVRVTR